MADAKIVLSAEDQSKGAFASISSNLSKLGTQVESVKGLVEALGVTLSVGYFADLVKGTVETADHLNDLSKSTAIAVEDLAGLKLLAKQSGTDMDGLAKGVNRMLVEIGKAPDKFKALGVTATDGVGALKQMADIFNLLPDITQRNALAQAVFSKSWAELAPVLSEGGQKIGETIEKGARLSGITTEMAKAADEFNDKLAELTSTHGFMNRQVATLLPLLNTLADDLVDLQNKSAGADSAGFHPLAETLRALIVVGGNVAFAFKGVGTEIGILAAQAEALGIGFTDMLNPAAAAAKAITAGAEGWRRFNAIGEEARANAASAREDFDKWEKKIMSVGTSLTKVAETSTTASKAEQDAMRARAKAFLEAEKAAKDAETAFAAINKSVGERLAGQQAEIDKGRALTDQEKFEAKIRADLLLVTKTLTAAERANIEGKLVQSARLADELVQRAKLLKMMQAEAAFIMDTEQEIADAYVADSKAREQLSLAIGDETRALKDAGEMLDAEGKLLGATDKEREIALDQLRIELKLRKDLDDLAHNNAFNGHEGDRDAEAQRIKNNAELAKQQVQQRENISELQHQWQSLDSAGQQVFASLFEKGGDTLHKLGGLIKTELIDELYKLTAQKWIFQIFANVTGGGGGVAGAASSAGGNAISSIGGNFLSSGASSLFGSGNMSAATSFATGNMSLANLTGSIGANAAGTGIDGLLASNAAFGTAASAEGGAALAAGVGAEAGAAAGTTAAAGALAAIPVAGWVALAALAIYSVVSKSGETRVGGQYQNGALVDHPSGGEIQGDATRTAIVATMGTINAELKALGSTDHLSNFVSGLEESKNGKGFAFAGGQLASGTIFGQGTDGQGFQNRRGSMTSEQAAAAFSEELKQATLQALQAANVPGILGDYLRQLGDVDKLSGGALDAAIGRINKALTEKQQLEDKLYDLTATDLQKLNKQRDAERASIDESNRALLDQVYAQEDLKNAADGATQAIQRARASSQAALSSVGDAFGSLQKSVGAERARLDAEYQAAIAPLQDKISKITDSVSKLASLSGVLRSSLNGFATNTTLGLSRSDASAQISQALALAKSTGQLPDQDSLQNALSVVAQPSEQLYGSFVDYAKAFDAQVSTITDLDSLTEGQLSTQKRELAAAEDTLKALTSFHNDSLARLDAIIATEQALNDSLNGGLLSISQALALLASARNAATTVINGAGGAGTPQLSSSGIHDLFNGALGLDTNPNATFDQIYQVAYANKDVLSLSSLAAAYPNLDPAAVQAALDARGLPSFDVGIASVPYDMTANIHRGERILTNSENAALTRAVEMMAARMEQQGYQIDALVTHNFYMRKRLDEFATIGMPVKNAPPPDNILTTSV